MSLQARQDPRSFDVWHNFEAKLEDKLPYYVAFEAIKEWVDIEGEQRPMLAFAASADPDTMYYHEAMREPDRAEFIKAMEKEVKSHTENEVWELVPRSSVPPGTKILPAVWAMKRKRNATRKSTNGRQGSTLMGPNKRKESTIGRPSHLWHHGQPSEWCSLLH
ncbi:hypothetical protein MHU86_15079 [Fragilaria crotonensis]|nr:hypothetical protein MHU86_15079 [Fragilaria crotonensis]